MKILSTPILVLILGLSLFLTSCCSDCDSKNKSGKGDDPTPIFTEMGCPENFVLVPALEGYTAKDFCIMKYEAKNDGSGGAVSQSADVPYVNISRNDSITKCTDLGEGYDLMTNDEWQSVARNIELVASNWNANIVGSGSLNRGHSDASPDNALAANDDDNQACYGTEQTCDSSIWDSQRRTHKLSNGEVIWDLSGNVWEWVKDDNTVDYSPDAYLSLITASTHTASGSLTGGTTTTSRTAKGQFGPSGDYADLNSAPYGGLGYGTLNNLEGGATGSVARGDDWDEIDEGEAGVFAVDLDDTAVNFSIYEGFRCAYHPN